MMESGFQAVSPLTCIFVVLVLVVFLGVAMVMVIVIVVIIILIILIVVLMLLQPFEPVIWGLCAMVAITVAGAAAAAHGDSALLECAVCEAAVTDHFEKGGSGAPNKGWLWVILRSKSESYIKWRFKKRT